MKLFRSIFLWINALLLAFSIPAEAQQSNIPRIGVLAPPSRSFFAPRADAFRQGLRDLGYVEGKNVLIEYRYAGGRQDRLPDLVAELIALKVDVILTATDAAVRIAKGSTNTIPVVFAAISDPVATGLITSLARPSGNVTGLTILSPELSGKRLEVLTEVAPKVMRVGILFSGNIFVKETETLAKTLGLQPVMLKGRRVKDFGELFGSAKSQGVQALLVYPGPLMNTARQEIVAFAAQNRLPAMYSSSEFVEVGGLMSYAPSYADLFRRAATYVDKILKGAKPVDLPVEQPTKFELVINLKTAKQIGLTIPPNVLARADRVIK
jgi:ABC-type uncharacterized transport system substrate-binding protein